MSVVDCASVSSGRLWVPTIFQFDATGLALAALYATAIASAGFRLYAEGGKARIDRSAIRFWAIALGVLVLLFANRIFNLQYLATIIGRCESFGGGLVSGKAAISACAHFRHRRARFMGRGNRLYPIKCVGQALGGARAFGRYRLHRDPLCFLSLGRGAIAHPPRGAQPEWSHRGGDNRASDCRGAPGAAALLIPGTPRAKPRATQRIPGNDRHHA